MKEHIEQPDQEPEVDQVRRNLIKAAWIVPAVMMLSIPKDAFAGYVVACQDLQDCKQLPDDTFIREFN